MVPHIGTLTRTLSVSLERLYENALDWEHLPWLHSSSFASIEIIEEGDWGWHALASLTGTEPPVFVELELRLDREARRWITTTLDGPGAGGETWTHAFAVGERETYIVIDFFAPGLEEGMHEAARETLRNLYVQLYDEDEAMMLDRQAALDERRARPEEDPPALWPVGSEDDVRRALPLMVDAWNQSWRLIDVEGKLVAHAARCPHRLGSLADASVDGREVICPWHGYRFDVTTLACTTGARCRLPEAPGVRVEGERVVLRRPGT